VAAPDTAAIVIGTWPYLHCQATLAALAADKHVMVEARMAMNAAEAEQMVVAAKANPHLITQVVPAPLSFGVDATLQRLIAEGYLGEILAIEVRDHSRSFLNPDTPLHWRQNADLSGMNILSLGIWYETLMRWVGEATAVMARGKTFVKMRLDAANGRLMATNIPEHLTVIADMACGAQATFSVSQVTGLQPVQEVVLYGRSGTLRFANQTLYGGQPGDEQLTEIPIPDAEQGYWRVEEAFINAIRGLEPIRYTTFDTGLKYMQFTESVVMSMKENKIITLP
jgi:predicted dehydrogenase